MPQKTYWRQETFHVGVMVALYVLIGNARSVEPNPFIPGAVVAMNMVIPVLAGVLYGPRTGFLVGLLGTLANALVIDFVSPMSGSLAATEAAFEYMAILPHAIMGFLAGYLRRWLPTVLVAGSLIVGHVLSIVMFLYAPPLFGSAPLVSYGVLVNPNLWFAIAYETFVGIIAVTVLAAVYRIGFERLR